MVAHIEFRLGLSASAVLLCVTHAAYGVFINAATAQAAVQPQCVASGGGQRGKGGVPAPALVLMVEATKLLIASALWSYERRSRAAGSPPAAALASSSADDAEAAPLTPGGGAASKDDRVLGRSLLLYGPPALLYCAANLLHVLALQRMVAAVVELLYSLQVAFSALLTWLFARSGRQLRAHHWAAVALLMAANVLAHARLDGGASTSAAAAVGVGVGPEALLVVLAAAAAATACLLSELLTKDRFPDVSVNLQNLQLYLWGLLLNALAWAGSEWLSSGGGSGGGGDKPHGSTAGGTAGSSAPLSWLACLTPWHAAAVLMLACYGVVTGIVIKMHGNVARVVAASFAVHVSALFSHLALRFDPTWQFVAGAALCQAAILLYNKDALAAAAAKPL